MKRDNYIFKTLHLQQKCINILNICFALKNKDYN